MTNEGTWIGVMGEGSREEEVSEYVADLILEVRVRSRVRFAIVQP